VIVKYVSAPVVTRLEQLTGKTMEELSKEGGDEPIKTLVEDIKMAVMTLDLQGDSLLSVEIATNNDESAVKLSGMAKMVRDMAQKQLEEMKQEVPDRAPPGLAEPLLAVAEQVLTNIEVSEDERRIGASIKMPTGLPELAEAIAPLAKQMSQAEPPPEVE
jgi:hypothetical protein